MRARGIWEISVFSSQFCCGPKTSKKLVLIQKKKNPQDFSNNEKYNTYDIYIWYTPKTNGLQTFQKKILYLYKENMN